MSLKNISYICRTTLAALVILTLPAILQIAFASPLKTQSNQILALKLQKNTSLNDLIQTSGYSISDEDVVLFLTEFMNLNPAIKSVSAMKQGTLVRVPIRHLKKVDKSSLTSDRPVMTKDRSAMIKDKVVQSRTKHQAAKKKMPVRLIDIEPPVFDRSMLLKSIESLFLSLGDDVSVEKEGFQFFSLNEKSDLSFDTGLFPIMDLHNDRILVIDYTGSFPDDMKDLLEASWPEYRVVRPENKVDLRSMVPLLLQEAGYLFQENGKMFSGGTTRVEYYSDFLVHGKNGRPMNDDISLVSILDSSEYRTPQEIISWLGRRDIRVIELSGKDRKYAAGMPGKVLDMQGSIREREFVESLLTLMGYPFSRNEKINLSPRKEMQFNLRADVFIDLGHKKKIIEFSGVSNQEIKTVQKAGYDIAVIEQGDGKYDILNKVMSLLSQRYTNVLQNNTALLTSGKTRYRLVAPGFVIKSLKGVFYMTDAELDGDLMQTIISEGITVVHF